MASSTQNDMGKERIFEFISTGSNEITLNNSLKWEKNKYCLNFELVWFNANGLCEYERPKPFDTCFIFDM